MNIEMRIVSLLIDPNTGMPVVVLMEVEGQRAVPIVIGLAEAEAIALGLQRIEPPRPRTHDLMYALLRALGGHLERVVIHDLHDSTFMADLYIRAGDDLLTIDARPSDAMGLATRAGARIFMAEHVLDSARMRGPEVTSGEFEEDEDQDELEEFEEEGDLVVEGQEKSAEEAVSPVFIDPDTPRDQLKEVLEQLNPEHFGKYKM